MWMPARRLRCRHMPAQPGLQGSRPLRLADDLPRQPGNHGPRHRAAAPRVCAVPPLPGVHRRSWPAARTCAAPVRFPAPLRSPRYTNQPPPKGCPAGRGAAPARGCAPLCVERGRGSPALRSGGSSPETCTPPRASSHSAPRGSAASNELRDSAPSAALSSSTGIAIRMRRRQLQQRAGRAAPWARCAVLARTWRLAGAPLSP